MSASSNKAKFTLDFCATLNERPALAWEDVYKVAYSSNMDDAKIRGRRGSDGECIIPLAPGLRCRVPDWDRPTGCARNIDVHRHRAVLLLQE